jgi:hypothetical protein
MSSILHDLLVYGVWSLGHRVMYFTVVCVSKSDGGMRKAEPGKCQGMSSLCSLVLIRLDIISTCPCPSLPTDCNGLYESSSKAYQCGGTVTVHSGIISQPKILSIANVLSNKSNSLICLVSRRLSSQFQEMDNHAISLEALRIQARYS